MGFFEKIGSRLGEWVEDLSLSEESNILYQHAQAAYEKGAYQDAEIKVERLLAKESEHSRGLLLLGLIKLKRDKLIDARSALERAHQLRKDDHAILILLARTQFRLADYNDAISSCKKALSGSVSRDLLDDLYGLLGEIFIAQEDYERAIRELKKAVATYKTRESNDPRYLELVGLLGYALAKDKNDQRALAHLSLAATNSYVDQRILTTLVEVLLKLEKNDDALRAAQRLVEKNPNDILALNFLAKAQLATSKFNDAQQSLLRSLELDASSVEAYRLLARTYHAIFDYRVAAEHLNTAYHRAKEPLKSQIRYDLIAMLFPLLNPVPDYQVDNTILDRLLTLADEMSDKDLFKSSLIALQALKKRSEKAINDSITKVEKNLQQSKLNTNLPILALLYRAANLKEREIETWKKAYRLDPNNRYFKEQLSFAFRQHVLLKNDSHNLGLHPLLISAEDLFLKNKRLTHYHVDSAKIRLDYDQPLMIAVMGEFNTGKSTFVNTLIGEEIAPMGITPTTATINMLKYGEKPLARIIYNDDSEKEIEIKAATQFLNQLGDEEALSIRYVEIMQPLQALQKVTIVDTPGLNSIVEDHEQIAREFIHQADVVIWLFSADQAGKETEEKALSLLQNAKIKTLAVINKSDRLKEEELGRVHRHLSENFSSLVDNIYTLSAKKALEALVNDNKELLEKSLFPKLHKKIHEELFAKSRRIKKEGALHKLKRLIDHAQKEIEQELIVLEEKNEGYLNDRNQIEKLFEQTLLEREFSTIHQELEKLFNQAAHEVLDFVRPRKWVLGSHQAEEADRDFFLELILDQFENLSDTSYLRIQNILRKRIKELSTSKENYDFLLEQKLIHLSDVYRNFLSFCRGFLKGGQIDDFFSRQLPNIDLDHASIARILRKDIATYEHELKHVLTYWYQQSHSALKEEIAQKIFECEIDRIELKSASLKVLIEIRSLLNINLDTENEIAKKRDCDDTAINRSR